MYVHSWTREGCTDGNSVNCCSCLKVDSLIREQAAPVSTSMSSGAELRVTVTMMGFQRFPERVKSEYIDSLSSNGCDCSSEVSSVQLTDGFELDCC